MSQNSRRAILQPLAEVEAALQQAEASRSMIGQAATALRKDSHNRMEKVERKGIHTPAAQQEMKDALLDRRRCDLVSGMTEQPQKE
ncbi:MAG: hypothetical protein Q7U76_12955 [Nitrospirota bacterium]|nr:hypothetical protein [Nitrospirota bacterium]